MRSAFDFRAVPALHRRLRPAVRHAREQQREPGPGKLPAVRPHQARRQRYRIELAVAGFKPDEIDITAQQNVLIVSGKKSEESERSRLRLHLSRHRDALVRAPLRARRPYPGARRRPEGRPARDRAGPRDPRGDEAAEDQHRRRSAQERSAIGGGEQPASQADRRCGGRERLRPSAWCR